jgi:hypothetical protein
LADCIVLIQSCPAATVGPARRKRRHPAR